MAPSIVRRLLFLLLLSPLASSSHPSLAEDAKDHNHQRLHSIGVTPNTWESIDEFDAIPDGLLRRAPDGVEELKNNIPRYYNLEPGASNYWTFTRDSILGPLSPPTVGLPSQIFKRYDDNGLDGMDESQNLKKRQQGGRRYFISINTCLQPKSNSSTQPVPPQLLMYISTDDKNPKPGPQSLAGAKPVIVEQGFALYNDTALEGVTNIYIGMHAPNSSSLSGIYNYEIGASIDGPFHNHNDSDPFLLLIDSDSDSALMITNNLTQAGVSDLEYRKWQNITPPFTVFAHNQNDTDIEGVKNSFCGLKKYSQIRPYGDNGKPTNKVDVGMTTRGLENKPKQQFYLKKLNASSTYYGFLAMEGNSTDFGDNVVGGGGRVWKSMMFTTKQERNCKVLFNLTFCSELAYAVPSNPRLNDSQLTDIYDNHARDLYKKFNYSLAQVPCETTSSAQYSLVRNCTHCAEAYKQWLCAVVIPRCEDFGSTKPYLAPRNIAQPFLNSSSIDRNLLLSPGGQSGTQFSAGALQSVISVNQSRNPEIDSKISPGPYKEVLPCKDLCYSLVQSCPASLGFACPQDDRSMGLSYGNRPTSSDEITCSFLGAVYNLNAGGRLEIGWLLMHALGVFAAVWGLL